MNSIKIEPTTNSPLVNFNVNGKLLIEGRSIPEDISRLFLPLIEFASRLEVDQSVIDINLEYFNTATSKRLLELLKTLDSNNKINMLTVNWHYESDDDDCRDMGEIFEDCLTRSKFVYKEHSESISLANQS